MGSHKSYAIPFGRIAGMPAEHLGAGREIRKERQ